MKRRLNGSTNNKLKKRMFIIGISFIFLFYLVLVILNFDRKYFYVESIFKEISSGINSLVMNKFYTYNCNNDTVINSRIRYLENENEELKDLLSLKKSGDNYVASEVTNHNIKTWFNKININNGYSKDIKKGDPVITENGLVGFVSRTSKRQSEVSLITSIDDNNLLSVLIQTDKENVFGVLRTYDKAKKLFKVTDVTYKDRISKGDNVILSGYDNKLYKGIYIGSVVKEKSDNYGLSKTIWVKSDVSFHNLLFVTVVTDK